MLDIRNLTCGYGKDPVLRDVTISIGAGEFVAVIGPNGSGKTTLLRAISRVIKPAKGAILLEGRDIKGLGIGEFARKVAVVGNIRDTDLPMSVEEFVLLGRIPHRTGMGLGESAWDIEHAHNAMALTGAAGLRERRVDKLSSGEKQMVSISRALAQEPRLLLLDEPTSHLDITHQVRVLDLIGKMNGEQGLTIITILHDLNLAGQYCDRLLLLKDGAIVKDGPPGEALTQKNIEDVYGTSVVVLENPASAKPCVCLLPSRYASRTWTAKSHAFPREPED
jgi:iron complex transport system ATP-binding protein